LLSLPVKPLARQKVVSFEMFLGYPDAFTLKVEASQSSYQRPSGTRSLRENDTFLALQNLRVTFPEPRFPLSLFDAIIAYPFP
jgi:hypothetical protein